MPERHILVLTDRDWTHPQAGGTGTTLYAQVSRWLRAGHRVTLVAGSYPGAAAVEQLAPRLTIHRMGSRLTVFPRAAWATFRGIGRDADVVFEVVNGIAFGSPTWRWLKAPTVPFVQHVHQDHYVQEMGWKGRIARLVAERLPLTLLYRHLPFVTISRAAHDDLVALGVPSDQIHVSYLGVEPAQFHPGERDERPRLLYLGRLKQYKRIEVVLDVLEAVPAAHLDIAGEGDHRPALEAAVAERGLQDRVTMHGFVREDDKAGLYGRAWLNLTASSAEGWCLTVMEAAACGTPTAALRVGGLAESVVNEETGLLAETPEELSTRVAALLDDPERRDELGAAAEARARGFTWERTAEQTLGVFERVIGEGRRGLRAHARRSETAKAAGMALATLMANAIAIVFTIVFTRLLGVGDYGALGALLSTFTILAVAGSALQVAVAREAALGNLGPPGELGATVQTWLRRLAVGGLAVTAASVILRDEIASLIAVPEHPWAAAAILPTGAFWLLLSVLRGALQGLHAYAAVGISAVVEAFGRLVAGLCLVLAGTGVTGAFLGTPVSMAVAGVVLLVLLRRRSGPAPAEARPRSLRDLVAGGWVPMVGLVFLAALQNIDVVIANRQMGEEAAGAYAAAVVAAKIVVWIAIGIGLYLLPEATRRNAAGLDPRPVFVRALALLGMVSVPALLIFGAMPAVLLRVAFGAEYTRAADALLVLGIAMTLLAIAYLAVQYMFALRRSAFLWILGMVAVIEPFLLSTGDFSLVSFSVVVLAVQCVVAVGALTLALRRHEAEAVPA